MKTTSKFFIFFAFFFLRILGFGQTPAVLDSLLNRYEQEQNDSTKVEALKNLSFYDIYANPKESIEYAKAFKPYAQKGVPNAAFYHALVNLTANNYLIAPLDTILSFYEKGLKIATQKQNKLQQLTINSAMMDAYLAYRMLEEATEFALKNIEEAKELEDWKIHIHALNVLGSVPLYQRNPQKASVQFKKALALSREKGVRLRHSLNNYGSFLLYQKKYDKSIEYLLEANTLSKVTHDIKLYYATKTNLGIAYSLSNRYEQGNVYFEEAYDFFKESKKKELMYAAHSLSINYEKQGKYDKAIKMAQEYKELNVTASQMININKLLINCYKAINKPTEIISLYEETLELKDSLSILNTTASIAEIETKYEVAQKEKQIQAGELALTKKQAEQNVILFITLGLLAFLLGFVFFYRSLRQKNRKMRTLIDTIKKQNTELTEVNEKLGQLNYSISHDALGFVNNILNFSNLLKLELSETDYTDKSKLLDIFEYSGSVHLLAEKLRGLIINLLTFAKLENVEDIPKTSTDLNNIVNEIKQFSLVGADKEKIEINADALPIVNANYDLIFQLMQNLINNAIKYSKESEATRLKISSIKEQDYYTIAIEDNGIGISKDKLENIFNPFFREGVKRVEGTGLGLNICKRIIEMHKGKMNATSVVGQGSTFCFSLPIE